MTSNTVREDQRNFTRIPFESQVNLVKDDERWQSKLLDISLKGVLITKPDDWEADLDDQYLLELVLGDSDVQIKMEVTVAHMEGEHIGLRCEHIDLDSITHLRRLVELNIGNTEILGRELAALGV